jgi:hypothetical protein
MAFDRGDIIRHRATGQRGVVIRVESDNTYVIDYGFGERGATCVQECVIEACDDRANIGVKVP